ncbi:hypothetical protein [Dolosigranulum pigrum]|uniref:hypothetical protein n=2 Tax=Dolosigranulum pigrum TaxID=29394 RepID=UPI0011BD0B6E|nr:hypothetical protein [Dolosigranulum pigrum]
MCKDKATYIKMAAENSISSDSFANSFELVKTIDLINFYSSNIKDLEDKIKVIIDQIQPPLMS